MISTSLLLSLKNIRYGIRTQVLAKLDVYTVTRRGGTTTLARKDALSNLHAELNRTKYRATSHVHRSLM